MIRHVEMIILWQKVEHYKIASYGVLLQIAITFNMKSIEDSLEKILQEEEETDLLLTEIAEDFINHEAAEEDDSEDNDDDDDSSSNSSSKAKDKDKDKDKDKSSSSSTSSSSNASSSTTKKS